MKVNSSDNNSISFNGFYNSNGLKKVLGFAEKNGALFMSGTSLALSATIRPLSILASPKTDKENKKLACAKSITSTLLDFIITLAISAPLVRAVKKIDKNPQKFLKPETITNLKEQAQNLSDSKAYTFANQILKLGIGLVIAIPKALANLAGIPHTMNIVFADKNSDNKKSDISFKGKDYLPEIIGKIINKKYVQEFSKKNSETNFPMHIAALKDTVATTTFMTGVYKSKKINEERKGPLIYNSFISTVLSILSAYFIDAATEKSAKKFIKNFTAANKNNPNLKKYIDGFRIAKPTIIMGLIYYAIIPLIATFFAERADKRHPIIKSAQ